MIITHYRLPIISTFSLENPDPTYRKAQKRRKAVSKDTAFAWISCTLFYSRKWNQNRKDLTARQREVSSDEQWSRKRVDNDAVCTANGTGKVWCIINADPGEVDRWVRQSTMDCLSSHLAPIQSLTCVFWCPSISLCCDDVIYLFDGVTSDVGPLNRHRRRLHPIIFIDIVITTFAAIASIPPPRLSPSA